MDAVLSRKKPQRLMKESDVLDYLPRDQFDYLIKVKALVPVILGKRTIRYVEGEVMKLYRAYAILKPASELVSLLVNDKAKSVSAGKGIAVSGVYFLLKDGKVVYIGQSVNVHARISQHIGVKDFDAVRVMPCDRENLNNYEGFLINLLRPPQNGDPAYSAPKSKLWDECIELIEGLYW